jgi:hypothetical protein
MTLRNVAAGGVRLMDELSTGRTPRGVRPAALPSLALPVAMKGLPLGERDCAEMPGRADSAGWCYGPAHGLLRCNEYPDRRLAAVPRLP